MSMDLPILFPQGVMARVYEAVVLLLLLTLLVLGIVWVASALLHDNLARKSLYGEEDALKMPQ